MTRRAGLAAGASALAVPNIARPRLAATDPRYTHDIEVTSGAGAQAVPLAGASGQDPRRHQRQVFPNSPLGKLQQLAKAVSPGAIAFSHNTTEALDPLLGAPSRRSTRRISNAT